MKKIYYVDINFENLDSCIIPTKENSDLLCFWMTKINESAMSVNLGKEFYTMKVAEEVYLTFSKDALEIKSSGYTLRKQLSFRNITSISIHYGKHESAIYHVLYQEESDENIGSPNMYQINDFLLNGDCNVTIRKPEVCNGCN
jgi:hypothetical protein